MGLSELANKKWDVKSSAKLRFGYFSSLYEFNKFSGSGCGWCVLDGMPGESGRRISCYASQILPLHGCFRIPLRFP